MKNRSFFEKVYQVVKQIPAGKVATYKQVAKLAGSPGAYRAVGTAMKKNPDLKIIPCHRVVGSDGAMHGYAAGEGVTTKMKFLKKEGVFFIEDKVQLIRSAWKR